METNLIVCALVILIIASLVCYIVMNRQEYYIPDSEQLYNLGPAFPPPYNMNGLLTSVRTGNLL